jgi:hypothetical protein
MARVGTVMNRHDTQIYSPSDGAMPPQEGESAKLILPQVRVTR